VCQGVGRCTRKLHGSGAAGFPGRHPHPAPWTHLEHCYLDIRSGGFRERRGLLPYRLVSLRVPVVKLTPGKSRTRGSARAAPIAMHRTLTLTVVFVLPPCRSFPIGAPATPPRCCPLSKTVSLPVVATPLVSLERGVGLLTPVQSRRRWRLPEPPTIPHPLQSGPHCSR